MHIDGHNASCFACLGDNLVGFAGGQAERFFGNHITAGIECIENRLRMHVIGSRHKQHVGLVRRQHVPPDGLSVTGIDFVIGKLLGEPLHNLAGGPAFFTPRPHRTNANLNIGHVRSQMAHPNARQSTRNPAAHKVLETLPDNIIEKHPPANNGDVNRAGAVRHGLAFSEWRCRCFSG